jgi:hypothetical protein
MDGSDEVRYTAPNGKRNIFLSAYPINIGFGQLKPQTPSILRIEF